ncbi:FecR family protein [Chitinophaga vietnamensis]|uniref:FecR family protein n=1 Tax=Chitinophaga vietnamensis TaxID=2593957 RepID=UPI00117844B0|nr:FecR domain-containing protein [Chitinophaga vietnamensis]
MNAREKNEFLQLLRKYRDGTLDAHDIPLLYQYIGQARHADVMDEWLDETFNDPAYASAANDYDPAIVFAEMQEHMQARKRAFPFWKSLAAASVALLIAITAYVILRPARAPQPTVFDAPPGKNGAILTLANGRQVQLDSMDAALPTRQGQATLQKTSGQLSYQQQGDLVTEATVYNTVSTPRGRQFKLALADGTQVWLNAGSKIRFPTGFTTKERKVELSGEAYFEVAQNPAAPFIVQLHGSKITVLGTHFNIADYEDENNTNTTLLTGAVKLQTGNQAVVLSPGTQATIDKSSGTLSTKTVDTEPVIAWTKDKLILSNEDFAGLMRSISRWYDVDIVYAGKVPALRIGGSLHRNVNLSVVLGFLEENGVHYQASGKTVTIFP